LQGNAADAMTEEITPVARWFINDASFLHDNQNLLKAGWSSLLKACAEAHDDESEDCPLDTDWFPIVRRIEIGPYRIVAILNQRDLVEEGNVMEHCIASYGQWFSTELARPFSIRCRRTDERLASMVAHEHSAGVWRVDQVSGYRNTDVSSAIAEAASAVVWSIEEAVARDPDLAACVDDARRRQPLDGQFSCSL
jgi:hypothetical protein